MGVIKGMRRFVCRIAGYPNPFYDSEREKSNFDRAFSGQESAVRSSLDTSKSPCHSKMVSRDLPQGNLQRIEAAGQNSLPVGGWITAG
jgi:hypothetical protein